MDVDSNDRLSARIAALRKELDAASVDLDRVRGAAIPGAVAAPDDMSLATTARRIVAGRQSIGEIFDPVLFADPATNMVLQLYVDRDAGVVTTSGACCAVAGVPRTTGLRLINLLCGRGLIEPYELASDRRATLLRLTPLGIEKTGYWLRQMQDLFYRKDRRTAASRP